MSDALPATEAEHPRGAELDLLATEALVALLIEDQREAISATRACAPEIAQAVGAIAERLADGGTLHYVGAGSSGRIATLDASEIPPTFGADESLVRAHIAGGADALIRAVEGAEDDASAGAAAMDDVASGDAVIGLSAGGGASFVIGALKRARACGAYTLAVVNVGSSPLSEVAEATIALNTGAEVLTGSTRLKAGTAQKVALNAISTAVMVRLGKVYGNLMVDVVAGNRKLRARAVRLVCRLNGVDEMRARNLLADAGWSVKRATVMHRLGVDARAAAQMLDEAAGVLRRVIDVT